MNRFEACRREAELALMRARYAQGPDRALLLAQAEALRNEADQQPRSQPRRSLLRA